MSKLTKYSVSVNLLMFLWIIMCLWDSNYYGNVQGISAIKIVLFALIFISMSIGFLVLLVKNNAVLLKIQAPITALVCIASIAIVPLLYISNYGDWIMWVIPIADALSALDVTILLLVLVYTGKLFTKETDKLAIPSSSLAFALVPIVVLFLVNSLSIADPLEIYQFAMRYNDISSFVRMSFEPTVSFASALLLAIVVLNHMRIRSRKLYVVTSVMAFLVAAWDIIFDFLLILLPELI